MSASSSRLHQLLFGVLHAAVATTAITGVVEAGTSAAAPDPHAVARAWETYDKIPMSFEANGGQTDSRVKFLSRGAGYGLFLEPTEATLLIQEATTLRMHLDAANKEAPAAADQALPGSVNYLRGNDAGKWMTDIKAYERVSFSSVYPGIDLVYYGNQRQLEYDFVVAPGADPSRIALSFEGATPKIDSHGDLVLTAAHSDTRFHKPIVYQLTAGTRVNIHGEYRAHGAKVRFALGPYDHGKTLIIDPVLSYSTYIGGNDADYVGNTGSQAAYGSLQGRGIAVDSSGNVYVTGSTASTNFPLKDPYQATANQLSNYPTVFVSKLNPAGTAFVYSTFLGGTVLDQAYAIAVDSAGSAYVVGTATSPDFPVTSGAFQPVCSPELHSGAIVSACGYEGSKNAFVTKLSVDGKSLVYSTFIGGDDAGGGDGAYGIALDAKNQAYVVGYTNDPCGASSDPSYYCFPTTAGAFVSGSENSRASTSSAEQGDGFLSVLSADGSSLLYSTLMTHPVEYSNFINATSVALDPSGNIYVTGESYSGDLSTTPGAFQTATGPITGGQAPAHGISAPRGYVAKFSPLGTSLPALTYLTYLGGTTTNGGNIPTGIVADAAGNAYILNYGNNEPDLPTTSGAYQTDCAGGAAYLAKLNPSGSALVWGTCFGGQNESGQVSDTSSLALDSSGNVYIAITGASTLPQVNPIVTTAGGGQAFVSEFDPTGSKLLFSTPVGGPLGGEFAAGLVLDAAGGIYLAGQVYSTDFPVTAGAVQGTYGGGAYDSFITKIAVPATTTTTLVLSAATAAAGQAVTLTATVAGPTGGAVPTGSIVFKNGTTTLATQTLNSTGSASYSTTSLAVGTYSLIAAYGGDDLNAASASAAANLSVSAAMVATTTSLAVSPANPVAGSAITFTATVATASGSGTATGTVTFSEGTTTLGTATLSAGKASFSTKTLAQGAHSIVASYAGDTADSSSASPATTLTVSAVPAADFAIALSPASGTVSAGSSATSTVTVTPANGFATATSLACSGLPANATCTFSPASLTPSGAPVSAKLTIATSVAATTAATQAAKPSMTVAGLFASVLLLPFFGRGARRMKPLLSVGFLLVAGMFTLGGMSGCHDDSGHGPSGSGLVTPAGTYSVSVTATSGALTHSATYALTVQ